MSQLLYHHCRPLEAVVYDIVKPDKKFADEYFVKSYEWVEEKVGFYPLFLGVGNGRWVTYYVTGYDANWRKKLVDQPPSRNHVLFSFENLEGIFMDFSYWHIAMNATMNSEKVRAVEEARLFKRSWTKAKWLKKALKEDGEVQLVTPTLDLRLAEKVYCRNKATQKQLRELGFENVVVKRVRVLR